jgi:uncharacterized protein (DUF486 family)
MIITATSVIKIWTRKPEEIQLEEISMPGSRVDGHSTLSSGVSMKQLIDLLLLTTFINFLLTHYPKLGVLWDRLALICHWVIGILRALIYHWVIGILRAIGFLLGHWCLHRPQNTHGKFSFVSIHWSWLSGFFTRRILVNICIFILCSPLLRRSDPMNGPLSGPPPRPLVGRLLGH